MSAVILLIMNDNHFKYSHPGLVTGKLSDFAGLFFTPLFLVALVGLVMNYLIRPIGPRFWISATKIVVAILVTDTVFVMVKLNEAANTFYNFSMTVIGFPSNLRLDATDLVALTINFGTYFFARQFFTSH